MICVDSCFLFLQNGGWQKTVPHNNVMFQNEYFQKLAIQKWSCGKKADAQISYLSEWAFIKYSYFIIFCVFINYYDHRIS